jgi:hypothetical protein
VIQRQLGQHANLGITSVYLQGIDSSEIISTVHGRPSPKISANAGLQLRRSEQYAAGSDGRPPADPTPHPRLATSRSITTLVAQSCFSDGTGRASFGQSSLLDRA